MFHKLALTELNECVLLGFEDIALVALDLVEVTVFDLTT
jgi:hypothetical protein